MTSQDTRRSAREDDVFPDVSAIHRDDELIEAIIKGRPLVPVAGEDHELATLLSNWRTEIVSPELPAGPTVDDVIDAVNQEIGARTARIASSGRWRRLRPIAAAASAIAIVAGATMAFSFDSGPGDALWVVKQVVFNEQAQSTVANLDARSDLEEAERLIAVGNRAEAQDYIDQAADHADDVIDSSQHDALVAWLERLQQQLDR
ncbi:anti-sigma-D factor RsdA [Antrihabitans sp. YC2-6]|uniref:anti-sigma-D factor RsdA n=1 Tax=Antrihabitans sp. YC2-6 TaxID=2799498 RepID=UPI0018F31E1B|nr:anti-sigma-D factor RsdA [Antrihabitans sp. YC2-6]MBJ8343714.1 hypothetical protein [Antrihabitans sp. YC2-6]